jgi:hypothetical protein
MSLGPETMPPFAPAETIDASPALLMLRGWLEHRLPAEALGWLDEELRRQRQTRDERRLMIALGVTGRRVGRAAIALSGAELAAAQMLRTRWRPGTWRTDETTRIALMLSTWQGDVEAFARRIEGMCLSGEVSEQVACLKGFAIFPAPARLIACAREAVRSSIQPIFEAIACDNPYPADHFEAAAYNHMVVKCVFSGVSIQKIIGIEERRNDDLLQMLKDLVSEPSPDDRYQPRCASGLSIRALPISQYADCRFRLKSPVVPG